MTKWIKSALCLLAAIYAVSTPLIGYASPTVKEMKNLGKGDSSGVPNLIEGLKSKDIDVRTAALDSVYELGPKAKDTLLVLIELLNSADSRNYSLPQSNTPGVEMAGYTASGRISYLSNPKLGGTIECWLIAPKGDRAMEGIVFITMSDRLYGGFHERTLENVIAAIGAMRQDANSAVSSLIPFLHDTQSWFGRLDGGHIYVNSYPLRACAADALGKIGPSAKSAIPDLRWALEDEQSRLSMGYGNQNYCKAIKEAISKIEKGK